MKENKKMHILSPKAVFLVEEGWEGGGEKEKPVKTQLDRVEYSVFEYPYPQKEGVLYYEGEICGYFTSSVIVFFSPVYSVELIFDIFKSVKEGRERRYVLIHTGNWGYNKLIDVIRRIVFQDGLSKDVQHYLSFLKGETSDILVEDKDGRLIGFYEQMWKYFLATTRNQEFAKELLKRLKLL